ncbi:MAG: hypothetical protein JST54_01105 [Deltaproteobacteria bacterium]|nr:hypothetical protein [Deltaproteobacteria bacterium]
MHSRGKQTRKPNPRKNTKRVRTTLGELLAAAYDATGGKAERAAELLTRGPLKGFVLGPRLRFV